ncbi:MAG: hydrogen peroxide-inducible genes activator [Bacteroidales bacterium]|nr:hydrogen peroxide-inducible genes activator [Bacteroidales bacterium]
MTLQQMEYILAVDKYRHFVKASEYCKVTQSTLSMMIKKMEEELDTIIFDRNSHPIKPTEAGEKIISQIKIILYNTQQLKEITKSERMQAFGDINIGVIPTVAPYIIPQFFVLMQKNSPNIHPHVFELQTSQIIEKLKLAELDMAILATPLMIDELLEIPLYYEKFVFYVSPNEQIYNCKEINSKELPSKHLWMLKEGHCLRNQVLNLCEKVSDYDAIYEAGSIDTLVKIVDANGGYTVIPELHVDLLQKNQQKNIRPLVNPAPVREISLVVRKDYVKERILNEIASNIKQIIPEQMIDSRLKKFTIKL